MTAALLMLVLNIMHNDATANDAADLVKPGPSMRTLLWPTQRRCHLAPAPVALAATRTAGRAISRGGLGEGEALPY
eukprot:935502-Prymnesium_polylepis.1